MYHGARLVVYLSLTLPFLPLAYTTDLGYQLRCLCGLHSNDFITYFRCDRTQIESFTRGLRRSTPERDGSLLIKCDFARRASPHTAPEWCNPGYGYSMIASRSYFYRLIVFFWPLYPTIRFFCGIRLLKGYLVSIFYTIRRCQHISAITAELWLLQPSLTLTAYG